MKFLWTTSNKIGSRIIKWGLEDDCSHFAVVFDESPDRGIVLHSTMSGVGLSWLSDFVRQNTIVHCLSPKAMALKFEEQVYVSLVNDLYGKPYDLKAFAYFGWCLILRKLLGAKLPSRSPVGSRGAYLCVEVAEALSKITVPGLNLSKIYALDFAILTPHDLFERMSLCEDLCSSVPLLLAAK